MMQYGDGMMLIRAHKRVAFDPFKAFDPVVSSTTQPYVLLVQPGLPARSIKELIALSATRPITYSGGGGVGGTVHVGIERLGSTAGLKLKYIGYKGASPSLIALMGGEIQMVAASAMASSAAIRTGKVRGLASTGAKRIASLPDIPTVAEQGVPGWLQAHQSLQSLGPGGNTARNHRGDQSPRNGGHECPGDGSAPRAGGH